MSKTTQIVPLPDGRFQLPRFAIIDEHDFVDERGKKQKFDKRRLARLAAKLNRRVADSEGGIPVVDGHTIDGMPNKYQPEIVGVTHEFKVEPFYNTGRHAIWATPIADSREAAMEFKRKPRRSIELHVDPRGLDDDIDPIALLGSVSPKRDLGQPHRTLKLARANHDTPIHYLPSVDGKQRYQRTVEEPEMGEHEDGGECTLTPADIKAVVAEILQTEPMKKLMAFAEKLEGEEQGAEEAGPDGKLGTADDNFEPEADGDVEPPTDREAAPPERKSAGGPSGSAPMGARSHAPAGHYSRRTVPEYTGDPMQWLADYEASKAMQEHPVSEEVGKIKAELIKYKRESAEKDKRLAALERRNIELEINENLNELSQDFEFDAKEEFQELVKMSREQRQGRYELIRKRYAKRADQVPGSGDYVMTRQEEAAPPRGRSSEPASKYARTGAEASWFVGEMCRRGIEDPDELLAILEKEGAGKNGVTKTR
jgi:hypothetical protein